MGPPKIAFEEVKEKKNTLKDLLREGQKATLMKIIE